MISSAIVGKELLPAATRCKYSEIKRDRKVNKRKK